MIELAIAIVLQHGSASEPAASCSPDFMVVTANEIPSVLDTGVSVRIPTASNETSRTLSIVRLSDAFYISIDSDSGKVADAFLDTSDLGDRDLSIFPSDVRANLDNDEMKMSISFPVRSVIQSWPKILDHVYVHFDGTTWTAVEFSYSDDCQTVQRELRIGRREE